jgi:hypothetical protein
MAPYIEAFWIRWEEMIEGPIDGTVEILRRLQARGVPLCVEQLVRPDLANSPATGLRFSNCSKGWSFPALRAR